MAAIRLLTILPMGLGLSTEKSVGRSPAFFPLVGSVIGGSVAGVFVLAAEALPVGVAAALALAVGLILTGAMHIDGLADSADGLFNSGNRKRRLEIMSDPRVGAFGTAAIGLSLLIKWAVISSLTPSSHWPVLIVVAASARFTVVPVMTLFTYARSSGIGSPYTRSAKWTLPLAAAVLIATVVVFDLSSGPGIAVAAILGGLVVAFIARWRLGGVTGDVYGAVIEVAEIAALLTVAAYVEAGNSPQLVWE